MRDTLCPFKPVGSLHRNGIRGVWKKVGIVPTEMRFKICLVASILMANFGNWHKLGQKKQCGLMSTDLNDNQISEILNPSKNLILILYHKHNRPIILFSSRLYIIGCNIHFGYILDFGYIYVTSNLPFYFRFPPRIQ